MTDIGSHRHIDISTHRILWVLVLFLSIPMITACSTATSQPIPEVILTRELIAAPGTITYENGCLFLEKRPERLTLVWWPRLRPVVDEDKGIVEIIEPDHEPVTIILNEQAVIVGGGFTEHPKDPEFDVIDGSAGVGSCPPPYWLVGGVRPE